MKFEELYLIIEANFKYNYEDDGDRIEINDKMGNVIVLARFYPEDELSEYFSEDEIYDMFKTDESIKIEHLNVKEEYRGKGYAKKLMDEAIKYIKHKKYSEIYLNASPMDRFSGLDLNELTKFYQKFKFKVILHQGGNNLMLRKM